MLLTWRILGLDLDNLCTSSTTWHDRLGWLQLWLSRVRDLAEFRKALWLFTDEWLKLVQALPQLLYGSGLSGLWFLSLNVVHNANMTNSVHSAHSQWVCTVQPSALTLKAEEQYTGEIAFRYDKFCMTSGFMEDFPLYSIFKPHFVVFTLTWAFLCSFLWDAYTCQ